MDANNEYAGFIRSSAGPAVRLREVFFTLTPSRRRAGSRRRHRLASPSLSVLVPQDARPKGAGALYVRRGVPLTSHTREGPERRLRAAPRTTLSIACRRSRPLARRRVAEEAPAVAAGEIGWTRDLDEDPGHPLVGERRRVCRHTSAILFEEASGEALLIRLDLEGIAVSVGSACSSGTLAPSPALLALGLSREDARSVVRFSLSRQTTDAEIGRVLEILPGLVGEVRRAALPACAGGPS